MARDITTMTRDLSPFEKRVLELVCEGKSNSAIATATVHTGKVIENTVSRSAQVFGIKSDTDTNLRVLLALAFRSHYGDQAFDKLHEECIQHEIDADGRSYCNGVTHHEDTK